MIARRDQWNDLRRMLAARDSYPWTSPVCRGLPWWLAVILYLVLMLAFVAVVVAVF